LIEFCEKYPNAVLLKHYVKENKLFNNSMFTIEKNQLVEILPVFSIVASEKYIVLSNDKNLNSEVLNHININDEKNYLNKNVIDYFSNINHYNFEYVEAQNSHLFIKLDNEDDLKNFKKLNSFKKIYNLITWSVFLFD
jgi:hypothetical protein